MSRNVSTPGVRSVDLDALSVGVDGLELRHLPAGPGLVPDLVPGLAPARGPEPQPEAAAAVPGPRRARRRAAGPVDGGPRRVVVLDVRTLQRLRLVVPPQAGVPLVSTPLGAAPSARPAPQSVPQPAARDEADREPTFDELVHGYGPGAAYGTGDAAPARGPLLARLAGRRGAASRAAR